MADNKKKPAPKKPPKKENEGGSKLKSFSFIVIVVLLIAGTDLAASLASMQEASRLSPSNAVYRLALSELRGVRGDWPAAAAQARAAGELEPSSPQARLLLAEAFCRLGRAGEARAAQDEALRLAQGAPSPETAYDRFVLGARRVPGGCL